MSRPRRHTAPPTVVLVLTAVSIAAPAQAQAGQAPQTPPARTTFVPDKPRTLQTLLEKVVWDPAQRGPLLVVAPERTGARQARQSTTMLSGVIITTTNSRPKGPEPDAQGNYRLPDIGDYFGRRARAVGSLTVFAPATMTVLATRLPKPDPYAGMGANEKLRLFQSTLTPAQWRTLGSAGGIGIGDLESKQRELFLSLLPSPFVVQPIQRDEKGQRVIYFDARSATGITLTPAQRQNVRLSLHRVLDWYFTRAGNTSGNTHIGIGEDQSNGARYELQGAGFGSDFSDDRANRFGVSLLEEVPSQLKRGQLPFDWSALDAPVSLEEAATVGELMKRVATQTRVPLYCDPRYADLSVYVRSNNRSVRAGDLLQALCWGVTGTFRKVGTDSSAAYVLTDDIEGLGTRHARLQAWASTNAALAEQRRSEVEDALAKAPIGDNVGWADGDSQRPDDALSQKIEAYRKKLSAPSPLPAVSPAQQAERGLVVPVSELPAAAQEMVRKQLESHTKSNEGVSDPIFSAPLQADRVVLDVQVQASFVVPGVGTLSAQGNGYSSSAIQSLTRISSRPRVTVPPALPAPDPISAIPTAYKQRALLVTARTADEATRAVAEAQAHGLNQVWLALPTALLDGGDTASSGVLAAAIAAGKKANVSVGAVVRLLRAPVGAAATGASALLPDRNIVGETTTEFAARRAVVPPYTSPFTQSFMRPTMTPREEAEHLLRRGDWIALDDSTVQAVRQRVAALAQTPGLAGLVLRDIAAPGYDTPTAASPFDTLDGAEKMGYTQEMRLAFLRESGIDPVDLSPLPQGRLALPYGGTYSPFLQMQLPFFPDYGPTPGGYSINNQKASELGAKDGPERWQRFRAAKADAAVQNTIRSIHTGQPEMPVWVQRGGDTFTGSATASFFDTAAAGAPSTTPTTQPAITPSNSRSNAEPRHSPHALLIVRCAPLLEMPGTATGASEPAGDFTRRLASLMTRVPPGWEGVVVDLSEVPLDRALTLLNILPTSPSSLPSK